MILFEIALRNLWSHKVKTVIVGGLLVFGSVLLMVGQSLLDSLDRSMAQSVVHSIAGHVQVWSATGKDKLALFGSPMDGTEIGHVADFPKVRETLEALPEVQAVIPMGIDQGIIYGGNILDIKLAELREAVKAGDAARIADLRAHVRRIVGLLREDLQRVGEIADMQRVSDEFKEGLRHLERASQDAFWAGFDAEPLAALEFLDNEIAPLALGGDMIFIRYLGTDTARFAKAFNRFEMVDGEPIPPGQRGFLFNKLTYEDHVKNKTARRLDKMKDRLAEGHSLATDEELQQHERQNRTQLTDLTLQFDERAASAVRAALQKELGTSEADLHVLLERFLTLDDANFERRYQVFYDVIAPRIMLYSVPIGETVTIRGFTESGYPTSVSVKVYGTFRFRSLDKSALAGATNLMDLASYRDLFGYMTADRKAELERLQQESGVGELSRDEAEAALFGEDTAEAEAEAVTGTVQAGDPSGFDEFAGLDMGANARRYDTELLGRVYSQPEIDGGVVRNAAIILADGVEVGAGLERVREVIQAQGLGLKAMDWREASGMVGDFIGVIRGVLGTAVLVIFIVALVIINNSMVMATLERTREIGTLRAIGAQRGMILRMFVVEAVVLGAVFGGLGTLIGSGLVLWRGHVGIPAFNDVMVFLFAGPRLHPFLALEHVVVALAAVFVVTLLSTLYPALLATRVTPLEAMQEAE